MSKIAEIFRRAVNDEEIFPVARGGEIFNKSEWQDLKKEFENRNEQGFKNIIRAKMSAISSKPEHAKQSKDIQACLKGLEHAYHNKPYLLQEMFNIYERYGLRWCPLRTTNQYGLIIERYAPAIVEQFFIDKINRAENTYTEKALAKALEYVKELYNAEIPFEEIAYFVRKLDSLQHYGEVIT